MKHMIAIVAVGLTALTGLAETVVVSNVTDLVAAIYAHTTASDTIQLAKGDYDLTGVQMEESSSFGGSHLLLDKVNLVGLGETPDEVRLIGDGTLRVIRSNGAYNVSKIENLTITNGYAKTVADVTSSGRGGGVYGYFHTLTNVTVIGCKSDVDGGGVSNYSYIRNCRILNNSSVTGGGVFKPNEILNSLVSGNVSSGNGGGVYGDGYGKIIDSRIIGNTANGAGGGVCAVTTITNSIISENVAVSSGGGLFSWGASTKFAYDCIICSNKAESANTYGGGANQYTIIGGEVFGNEGRHGGGVAYSVLTDVKVHDNYALGYGGGCYQCVATNCVINRNNGASEGKNGYANRYVGCEISGSTDQGGKYLNCRIHDIGNAVTLQGNPYNSDTFTPTHALNGIPVCTNCLFYNLNLNAYGHSIICGISSSTRPGYLVNCTFVSNVCGKTFAYFSKPDYPLYVENCVFFGNKNESGSEFDLWGWGDSGSLVPACIKMSNVVYGWHGGAFTDSNKPDWAIANVWQWGKDDFPSDPKFAGPDADPENPYALKRASPLRGRGAVSDWMADATDIRGEGYARLRDGKVDLGCYQCWLDAVGALLIFR